jgi:hypothetical protein
MSGAALGIAIGVLAALVWLRAPSASMGSSPPQTDIALADAPTRRAAASDVRSDDERRMTPLVPVESPDDLGWRAPPAGEATTDSPATIGPDGDVRVVVLVDQSLRQRLPDWASVVPRRLLDAGRLLRAAGGPGLVTAGEPLAWTPPRPWRNVRDFLDIVSAAAPRLLAERNAGLVLGLGFTPRPETDDLCGLSRPFTEAAVVLDVGFPPVPPGAQSVTIAHEVAHCFGCFHVQSAASVMVPKLGRRLPRAFDSANARVLQACANAVLSRGEEGVAEEALIEVARLTREFGVPSEHNNAAYQLAQRAYRVMRDSDDLDTGIRLCRVALSFEPQLASARANLAYALAMRGSSAEAERELGIALRDSPELLSNDTVRDLSHKLGMLPPGS